MRIITGRFKGANLHTVDGKTTRPTTDYNRELIFSVHSDYEDLRILDLFAGTGSFGLEALSRGADYVDFVEFASKAIAVLLQNINKLKCSDLCHIHRRRVEQYLRDCKERYDVIFLDPPYLKNLVNPVLDLIQKGNILSEDGIIIVEHSPKEPIAEKFLPFLIKEKPAKVTSFSLLQFPSEEAPATSIPS